MEYFIICKYDERSLASYDGLHLQKNGKTIVQVNTGSVKLDHKVLSQVIKTLKLPPVAISSRVDNYEMDLSSGKALLEDNN